MAYTLPLVRVFQQLEEVSPTLASPDLPCIVIGRAYQVMTYVDNKVEVLVGEYDKNNGNTFNPPGLYPGGLLESSSVKLYMDEMYIEITNGTFDATLNSATLTDLGASFDTDDIEVGDIVVIDHTSLSTAIRRIVLDTTATTITLNKNFTADMTGATYSVQKKLDDRLLGSSDFSVDGNEVTVDPALQHTYNSVSYPVQTGTLYMEFKALRTDLSADVDDVSSTAEIESKIGTISKDNPLALGVYLARLNTTTPIKFIGVNTKEGDEAGWSDVKDILENKNDVYFLSLLTDNSSVVGTFKTHCEQMSTADYYGWRVCSGGTDLVTEKEMFSSATGEVFNLAGSLTFRDNSAEFLTDGISPSDRIEVTAPNAVTGSYVVNTVVNDNVIEVTSGTPFLTTASDITYTIQRDLSKTQQAEEIAAAINSFDSKRTVIVWSNEIEVNGDIIPGYFLGCVIGGMVAGLPPQQGFTNLGVAGIDRIYNSNTYFNRNQLNLIAEAGGWIFVQDSPTALPYVRHQLTTDMQFVETRELSVVKNFDHLSYYFFDVLSPFIGEYNITSDTIGIVRDTIRLAAESKTKEVLPKIGAPLSDFTIRSVEQSSTASDRIEGKVKLDLPKPLNGIDLYLAI